MTVAEAEGSSRRSRPRILAAALRSAMDEGSGPLTMEAIASCAGVTRRTVYNHFANVADLCVAACDPMFEHCQGILPRVAQDCWPDPRPQRARVHALALDVIAFLRDPVHLRISRMVRLQAGTVPALARAYRARIGQPLERAVAARLATLPNSPAAERHAREVLATLGAVNRLEYLVADLRRTRASSVIVDLVIDLLDRADMPQERAA